MVTYSLFSFSFVYGSYCLILLMSLFWRHIYEMSNVGAVLTCELPHPWVNTSLIYFFGWSFYSLIPLLDFFEFGMFHLYAYVE